MINQKEMQAKISKYIGFSFLNSELIVLLKTNKEFQKIINLLINISIKIEDPLDIDSIKVNQSFKKTFIDLVGHYDENLLINIEDEDEINDNVKAFDIFIQNTLNKTVSELMNETSNINEKVMPDSIIEPLNNTESSQNNEWKTNKTFNAEEFIHNSGTNVNEIAEMMVRQQAAMIVQNKILKGEVFVFNSKPKIIPIIKIIIAILFSILLVFSIVGSAILLSLNQKISIEVKNADGSFRTAYYSFLSFPIGMIFTILINIFLVYSLIRNFKNDNAKYFINWFLPLAYTVILLITILLETGTERSIVFNPNALKAFFQVNNAKGWQEYWPLIENYRYIQFTCIAIIVAILSILIISIFYNPKRDFERIEKLTIEYINKIKNGEIKVEDSNPPFGSRFASGLF